MIKFKVTIYKRVLIEPSVVLAMITSPQVVLKPVRSFYADDIDGVYDLLDVFAMEQHGLRNLRGMGHSTVKVFFKLKWEPPNDNPWIELKDSAYYNSDLENLSLYGY